MMNHHGKKKVWGTALIGIVAAGCASVLEPVDASLGVEIVSGPQALTSATSATFEMVCENEGACELECALDGARFQSCESTVTYEALDVGPHIFEAQAVDTSGRVSEVVAWEWTIEETGDTSPTLQISGPDTMAEGVATAELTFEFSESVAVFGIEDIDVSPEVHTLSDFESVDDTTFTATLHRSGNEAGTILISVGGDASQGGGLGAGASHTIELLGEVDITEPCEVPDHVEMSSSPAVTRFGESTGAIEFTMPPLPTVLSHPFTTTDNPEMGGQVNMVGTSQTGFHRRKMWISECPGGEALSTRCSASGIEITIRWRQEEARVSCTLETDKTYYFNVSYGGSTDCDDAEGCPAIIQHLGGWD
ncbi:hypothetical protein FRC96_08150 [Lujinxingia vulgaris]|uniref:Bacterial Ig-like domain-containing protein n=1 Tax=Lujinxingia vulgaris TaxID=2600176 RepID=A0A5C6XIG2_9DELT|nr:Ig-like domain-containing protein [Lujinxingia vulgaris]TXD37922.1 hypothetical protein FRC96_08150 [Lujinxingia vulgaris]